MSKRGSKKSKKMYLVDWDTVTRACYKGSLGVSDLGDINTTLLVKWIYRYGNKPDRLWRCVVCAKSNAKPRSLIMPLNRRSRHSILVKLIGSLMDRNECVSGVTTESFRLLIGNGSNTDFWADNWTGKGVFKVLFPGIFPIILSKQGSVSSFGHWVDSSWN